MIQVTSHCFQAISNTSHLFTISIFCFRNKKEEEERIKAAAEELAKEKGGAEGSDEDVEIEEDTKVWFIVLRTVISELMKNGESAETTCLL